MLRLQGLQEAWVVERFEGIESVCGDNRLQIDCLSTDAFLDLEPWLEQPLTLQLRQADGALRQLHGLCTEAAQLGSDGGLARYRLILEPWTALLRLRRNAVIFQDLDTRAICEQIFADYPQAVFRFDVQAELPARAITTQYRVVTRLLAEAGLAWRIEQAQGDEANARAQGMAGWLGGPWALTNGDLSVATPELAQEEAFRTDSTHVHHIHISTGTDQP
ncbi:hypothetical protein ARC23_02445 [Stenotrophomonas beteli]|uniref:Type VI secretion system tip protein VgrG n=1 Tax=Stenotrophomonas beteli TaxID=3384461 RepID=A0A0R0B733_9GAMM|nr:hypothetical protein ARC23_02445 [Stenotrophomonas maltophilia]